MTEFHPVQVESITRKPRIPTEITLRAYEVYCELYGEQRAMVEGGCRGEATLRRGVPHSTKPSRRALREGNERAMTILDNDTLSLRIAERLAGLHAMGWV